VEFIYKGKKYGNKISQCIFAM